MELLDRYIAEIGRHLPDKSRMDIEREIRSNIEDMLEDRSAKTGQPVDENLLVEVLQQYGSPSRVAASYQKDRYLIGPRLYPLFLLILKVAVPGILILGAIGFFFTLSQGDWTSQTFISAFLKGMANLFNAAVLVFGNVALVFALLERFVPDLKVDLEDKNWDPRKLPKVPTSPDKVSIPSLAVEVAFTVIGLVIFNFFPQLIGFGYSGTEWVSIPVLADVFFTRYLPFINIIWVAEVFIAVLLISRGRWETATTWLYITFKVLTIALAIVMLTGPSFLAITAEQLAASSAIGMDTAQLLISMLQQVVRWSLVIVIFFTGLDIAKISWKQITRKPELTSPVG